MSYADAHAARNACPRITYRLLFSCLRRAPKHPREGTRIILKMNRCYISSGYMSIPTMFISTKPRIMRKTVSPFESMATHFGTRTQIGTVVGRAAKIGATSQKSDIFESAGHNYSLGAQTGKCVFSGFRRRKSRIAVGTVPLKKSECVMRCSKRIIGGTRRRLSIPNSQTNRSTSDPPKKTKFFPKPIVRGSFQNQINSSQCSNIEFHDCQKLAVSKSLYNLKLR